MTLHKSDRNPWDNDNQEPPKAWNQNRNRGQGNLVDDLIDQISNFIKGQKNSGGGGNNQKGPMNFKPLYIVYALLVVFGLWLMTGIYKVEEGNLGVVLRFGEMVRMSGPGLQYHFPNPIENVIVQNVSTVSRIDGSLRSESSEASEKTFILTGDENMVHTNFTVLWKIKNVSDFLFIARDPVSTIRTAAESCIREVIGQTLARLVLTEGRDVIEKRAQELLQKLMDDYKIGVLILNVQLQRVEPPREVIAAFNDVQASIVDADRLRNEAEAYRNDILPRARGEVERVVNSAEAYKAQQINYAQGQASRFRSLLSAYKKNPTVTMKRYYLEAMQSILSKKTKIIMEKNNSVLPYLPLDRLTQMNIKPIPVASSEEAK